MTLLPPGTPTAFGKALFSNEACGKTDCRDGAGLQAGPLEDAALEGYAVRAPLLHTVRDCVSAGGGRRRGSDGGAGSMA